MRVPKFFKIIFWMVGIVIVLFLLILYLMRPHTPKIRDQEGKIPPDSITSLEKITISGYEQWISIRGDDVSNPILLFLHGGPGMPMMYLSHVFQHPLEKEFICVQWDRRGAGKSFCDDLPVSSLNVAQLLADTKELIHILCRRYSQDKVYLAGHSFGSYLGTLFTSGNPELVEAYIGIGQVVDDEKATEIQARFILETAESRNIPEALEELKIYGPSVHEKWLFKFGGELVGATSYMPFIKAGILSPEYGFFDILKISKGSSFSSRYMQYNVIAGPLMDNVREFEVPIYFFSGRHDYVTPFELVQKYCSILEAPYKEIVWFDNSAHFPFFEEPDEFGAEMIRILKTR